MSPPQQDCDLPVAGQDGGLHVHTQGHTHVRSSINVVGEQNWRSPVHPPSPHPAALSLPASSGEELDGGRWAPLRSRPQGSAHRCTAAWKRCRSAVQSLPPLKPTQRRVRSYRASAVSMVCRAPATFSPREDPASTQTRSHQMDARGCQRTVRATRLLLKVSVASQCRGAGWTPSCPSGCAPTGPTAPPQCLPSGGPGFLPLP